MSVRAGFDPLWLAGEAALGVGSMYFMMSYNEYVTHRYFQHAEINLVGAFQSARARWSSIPRADGAGHIEHHAETRDEDMSLKIDDPRWVTTQAAKKLDDTKDPWRGTAFSWPVTGIMTMQMLPQVYPWFLLVLGWDFSTTSIFFGGSMILHALIWNALHPNMHGLPDVPLSEGAPSFVLAGLRGSPYFQYLYDNHAGHHVSGGKTNYNVACPMFDHILGTFEETPVWKAKLAKKMAMSKRTGGAAVEAPAYSAPRID